MSHHPTRGDVTDGDDLTRITGIGLKTAERLAAAGIRTYAALAAHTADDIIALLPDIAGLSAARVDGWRDQARALQATASAGPSPAVPDTPEGTSENGQHYESFLVRILLNDDGSVRRTTAQHIRTGRERHWPRLDHAGLPEFIETAIAAAPPPSAPEPATEAEPPGLADGDEAPAAIVPSPRESSPATAAGAPRSSPPSSAVLSLERTALRAGEPFTMTMTISFAEPAPRADRLAYSAVIVARPLAGGAKRTLAQADGLLAASLPAITIEAAGLPSGAYRLDGAVSLREPGGDRLEQVAALAEGLLVQVAP